MWIKIADRYINLDNVTSISLSNERITFYFGSSLIEEDETFELEKGTYFSEQDFNEAKRILEEKLSV